jgi:hypothetical protein
MKKAAMLQTKNIPPLKKAAMLHIRTFHLRKKQLCAYKKSSYAAIRNFTAYKEHPMTVLDLLFIFMCLSKRINIEKDSGG